MTEAERLDGYRGIWYADLESEDEYRYVYYSGGLGTYTAKHRPMAIHAEEVNRTYFTYGGVSGDGEHLYRMVSWYDHTTGMVPRPVGFPAGDTGDAHDNPAISLDDDGHIWVFASAHGEIRPATIYRSNEPWSIDGFELISETNFSYPQPWHLPGKGFLFLHTRYIGGRNLYWSTSPDGREWSEPEQLAAMDEGHYQISWANGSKVGTAFNYHPSSEAGGNWENPEEAGADPSASGTNNRTNLYYLETDDVGESWRTVDGMEAETPLTGSDSPALVHNYLREGLLVYLKDMAFDHDGRPILLYLTSRGSESGPQNDPRTWQTAYWNGSSWELNALTTSDNNYDSGSIYVEEDGSWTVIAPTGQGPQAWNAGGEIQKWVSRDHGASWEVTADLTQNSEYNHSYVKKPLNHHPGFVGFWADGHGRMPSASRLYFTDWEGSVYQLPETMTSEEEMPD
ncbi:MAG: BNR-4 repeat-containing protein [Balneolaceae bacterium]